MDLHDIKQKAESFFEWTGDKRDSVTYNSAMVFAWDCVKDAGSKNDFDAKRLRVLAKVAGCEDGMPDDATAVSCAGTVLGMIRGSVERIVAERDRLNAGQWISVKDRMPDIELAYSPHGPINHTEYIVCRSDGIVQYSPAYTGLGFANIRGGRDVTVTHWMPLPSPPVPVG